MRPRARRRRSRADRFPRPASRCGTRMTSRSRARPINNGAVEPAHRGRASPRVRWPHSYTSISPCCRTHRILTPGGALRGRVPPVGAAVLIGLVVLEDGFAADLAEHLVGG